MRVAGMRQQEYRFACLFPVPRFLAKLRTGFSHFGFSGAWPPVLGKVGFFHSSYDLGLADPARVGPMLRFGRGQRARGGADY